jgi:hypothetical protein
VFENTNDEPDAPDERGELIGGVWIKGLPPTELRDFGALDEEEPSGPSPVEGPDELAQAQLSTIGAMGEVAAAANLSRAVARGATPTNRALALRIGSLLIGALMVLSLIFGVVRAVF